MEESGLEKVLLSRTGPIFLRHYYISLLPILIRLCPTDPAKLFLATSLMPKQIHDGVIHSDPMKTCSVPINDLKFQVL